MHQHRCALDHRDLLVLADFHFQVQRLAGMRGQPQGIQQREAKRNPVNARPRPDPAPPALLLKHLCNRSFLKIPCQVC